MSSNEWGLTERGFRRPTYTELLDALEYKARELFGTKANLTVRSPIGLFLRIYAWILNMLFSTIEDVYNSRFVDTAVGTQPIQPRQGHRPSPPFGAKGQRLHHRQGHTGHHRTGRLARGHRSGLSVRRCGGRRDRQRRHRNATGAGHRSRRRRQRREGDHHDHRKPRHPGRNHKRQQSRGV